MTLDAALSKEAVFEADELAHEMYDAENPVSRATIYRTLKHLVDANVTSEVLLDSKQSHYKLSFGREPMSHLVCVETNEIVEFSQPEL